MADTLTYQQLKEAVAGGAAAFRCITKYQPAGGPGDKVFPPTYLGGIYAFESRRLGDRVVRCVLLDSVQSQANRLELALLQAWEDNSITLPVIAVDFSDAHKSAPDFLEVGTNWRITSLEAPHRIADAILRDSYLKGTTTLFKDSEHAARWATSRSHNATALFALCPTALLFGTWGSPEKAGGLGAKFARAIVSEIVGVDVECGVKTSSRIDPLGIRSQVKVVRDDGHWRVAKTKDEEKKGLAPSEVNHGNIPPTFSKYTKNVEGWNPLETVDVDVDFSYHKSEGTFDSRQRVSSGQRPARQGDIAAGGVTIHEAIQTTVLSLPALRRLRFPLNGEKSDAEVDKVARTVLAALGLCAAALFQEQGCDLRSRCQLVPVDAYQWELIGRPGEEPKRLTISADAAIEVYKEAVDKAKKAGLPWMEEELTLTPSPELVALVKKSQELAAKVDAEEGE